MTRHQVTRNKINATREELTRQIEERRMEREMQKQAKLDEDTRELHSNQEELQL